MFALKNMGWSERQEVEFKGSLASIDLTRQEQLERDAKGCEFTRGSSRRSSEMVGHL